MYNRIQALVAQTIEVRDCLAPEQRKQLDGGSPFYRAAHDRQARRGSHSFLGDADSLDLESSPSPSASSSSLSASGSAVTALKHLHGKRASWSAAAAGGGAGGGGGGAGGGAAVADGGNGDDDAVVKLWLDELLPNWGAPAEVRKRVGAARRGHGIPPSIRGAIWKHALGNHLDLTLSQFEQLCAPVDGEDELSLELIGHDLPRTFHRLQLFVHPSEAFSVDLRKVLHACSRRRAERFPHQPLR